MLRFPQFWFLAAGDLIIEACLDEQIDGSVFDDGPGEGADTEDEEHEETKFKAE